MKRNNSLIVFYQVFKCNFNFQCMTIIKHFTVDKVQVFCTDFALNVETEGIPVIENIDYRN